MACRSLSIKAISNESGNEDVWLWKSQLRRQQRRRLHTTGCCAGSEQKSLGPKARLLFCGKYSCSLDARYRKNNWLHVTLHNKRKMQCKTCKMQCKKRTMHISKRKIQSNFFQDASAELFQRASKTTPSYVILSRLETLQAGNDP